MKRSGNRWMFVADSQDARGEDIVKSLTALGYSARLINSEREQAQPGEVAIFGMNKRDLPTTGSKPKHMRLAAHDVPNDCVPEWAQQTAFRVAIVNTGPIGYKNGAEQFRPAIGSIAESLWSMARAYEAWNPHKPGQLPAPWGPEPTGEKIDVFIKWRGNAYDQLPTTTPERIFALNGITTLYGQSRISGWKSGDQKTLLLMGCVQLNRARTDVAGGMNQQKMQQVVNCLGMIANELLQQQAVERIVVAMSDDSMLLDTTLRDSLNPLLFADLAEIGPYLNGDLPTWGLRRDGNLGARTDAQVAEALQRNRRMIETHLVNPLATATRVPVEVVPWIDLYAEILDDAKAIVEKHRHLVEGIYARRAQTYHSYKRVHQFLGEEAGLRRSFANAALYVADALLSVRNPELVTIDYEYDDQWMQELLPALITTWGNDEGAFVTLPANLRQPWIA